MTANSTNQEATPMTLRVLSAFLFVFCLLALVVHLDGIAQLFGASSVALLAIDLLLAKYSREDASGTRVSPTRLRSIL